MFLLLIRLLPHSSHKTVTGQCKYCLYFLLKWEVTECTRMQRRNEALEFPFLNVHCSKAIYTGALPFTIEWLYNVVAIVKWARPGQTLWMWWVCELCLVMQCENSISVLATLYWVPQCQHCMLRSKLWYKSNHTPHTILLFFKKQTYLKEFTICFNQY